MLEADYQRGLIRRLKRRFPGIRIEVNTPRSPGFVQGYPDLKFFYGPFWGLLEVKAHENAPHQPNQDYYIELYGRETFARFIYPENEAEVLDALQTAFASCRYARQP